MRSTALAATTLAMASLLVPRAGAQVPPAGFTYETVTDGVLNRACSMAFAPDGRLFLAERVTGDIRVLKDGQVQAGVWGSVTKIGSATSEQGLLGIAIDPDFLNNGYVYVYYTTDQFGNGTENVITRFEEVGGVGTNETLLLGGGQISSVGTHNGGRLVFGQDGKLYVGTGDRQQSARAQDKGDLHGKTLRLNADGTAPADNPFATDPLFHPLVWSYGHRNQYGLTVNPMTGDVFQTENGLITTDEVNRIIKGGNYGWPMYEGNEPVQDPTTEDPLAVYSPTPDPTGTCFYDGENYPASYQNAWFHIQYSANRIRHLTLDGTGTSVVSDVQFDDLAGQGFDILNGPDGNLWYLTNDTGGVRGGDEVGRYVHDQAPFPGCYLTAVSNRILGGSMTLGFHGADGDVVVGWLGITKLGAPISTSFGDFWVPITALLPPLAIVGDDRAYVGISVPDNPALVGISMHAQAGVVGTSIALTNPATITFL